MPLPYLLRNRIILNGHPYNINDEAMGKWEFWRFQVTIDDINKIKEEKEDNDSINALTTTQLYETQK
jgi:hypothetical protein